MDYKTDSSTSSTSGTTTGEGERERERGEEVASTMQLIRRLASENAVVIFSVSTCCMCHAVKQLFCGMGVNPTAYELDEDPRGKHMEHALITLLLSSTSSSSSSSSPVPVVFIGGNLVGGMDTVMASHINGTLVPLLRDSGALWL